MKQKLLLWMGAVAVAGILTGYLLFYFSYGQKENRMIEKARQQYYAPIHSITSYIRYYNEYPDGQYTNEAIEKIVDYYSNVESLYDYNVRSKAWETDKLHKSLQPEIAKRIVKKTQSEYDIEDYNIYYIEGKDKVFLDGGENWKIENIGKRRPFKIKGENY